MKKVKVVDNAMTTMYFTYVTQNKINSKRYFGVHKTENINDGYLGSGKLLNKAIRKYGKENFEVIQRCEHNTLELALEMEELVVDADLVADPSWYNLTNGGGYPPNINEFSEERQKEIKAKISAKNKGRKLTKDHCEKIRRAKIGTQHNEETKEKIRQNNIAKGKKPPSRKGSVTSDETKAKLREASIRNGNRPPDATGRKHTESTKAKMSKAKKGKPGHKQTQATRDKIAKTSLGRFVSDETKQKLRKSKPVVTCPHCNKVGGKGAMSRWHFDNCKEIK